MVTSLIKRPQHTVVTPLQKHDLSHLYFVWLSSGLLWKTGQEKYIPDISSEYCWSPSGMILQKSYIYWGKYKRRTINRHFVKITALIFSPGAGSSRNIFSLRLQSKTWHISLWIMNSGFCFICRMNFLSLFLSLLFYLKAYWNISNISIICTIAY